MPIVESPKFQSAAIDLSERKRDGLFTSYWQRWLKGIYEALARPLTIVTARASQFIGQSSSLVLVDATLGAVVLMLPTAKNGYGIPLNVKKIDSTGSTVTIQPQAGELIEGAANLVISAQYQSKSFVSDGSAWWVIQ